MLAAYTHTASLSLKCVGAHTTASTYSGFEHVAKGALTLDLSSSESAFRGVTGRISKAYAKLITETGKLWCTTPGNKVRTQRKRREKTVQ